MTDTTFEPVRSIPDLTGRVYFVTGGTTGLGAGFISFIAAQNPAKIFFSGRNKARAEKLISDVKVISPSTKVVFIECDLSNLSTVQQAAKHFLSKSDRLDVLMCNAGVMVLDPALSVDGYEIQFATNHLGHALLIKLLLPAMLKTASQSPDSDVRIINLSSTAYTATPGSGIEFDTLKTTQASLGPFYVPSKFMRYGQSKLANLLYPIELARRHPSITSVAVHPGFIRTELHSHENFMDRCLVSMVSGGNWTPVQKGPYTQTWAATTVKTNLENGAYYEPIGVKVEPTTALAKDKTLAKKLYDWTEQELAAYF
ncbi:retinol dehydrogenase 14 [Microthyrium microscopicum]|uniref:Retinol dehydrogenase 14 n=1 Tax=Microthyrium microscopicum TaxID=703497 RepID=A0A6A6TZ50_9PEZI|nr:retinol dehydrogenase 14 [Microthyrium microscopicum]